VRDQEEAVTITLLVIGGGLGAIAAFAPRVEGIVEFGKDGFKFPVRARSAEKQIQQGKLIDADDLSKTLEDIKAALSPVGTPTITQEPPRAMSSGETEPDSVRAHTDTSAESAAPPAQRKVSLVDDAVVEMLALTAEERNLVRAEVVRMGHPDFREESDPRAIRRGDAGRSYRVHKVPQSNIRLWYRRLDKRNKPNPRPSLWFSSRKRNRTARDPREEGTPLCGAPLPGPGPGSAAVADGRGNRADGGMLLGVLHPVVVTDVSLRGAS
jgi:hypothetical protein